MNDVATDPTPNNPPDTGQSVPPWARGADDVVAETSTSENGLSAADAEERLASHGPNELVGKPPTPKCKKFLAQFQDPLVYLLLVAVAISLVAWILEGASGVPIDATVIIAILLINAIIGYVQEEKASDAVAALQNMAAATAIVMRDGQQKTIDASEIVPGDVLVLSEGDSVAADARLISASSLRIQESSLTGESEAVTKTPDVIDPDASLGDRTNMVFKGTAVVQGVGRAVVTATGMDTEMGAIATMLDETEQDESPLEQEVERISKMLGVAVIVIAAVVMGVLFLINDIQSPQDAIDILLLGVSLAVAAVPEGLPAILTVVLAIGVRKLAEHNAIVKELHSVETLGAASVIGSDKTGTLTRNEMTIREVITPTKIFDVSGTGYEPVGDLTLNGNEPDDSEMAPAQRIVAIGALANNSQLAETNGMWEITGDPTEAAFLVAARKIPGVTERIAGLERLGEIPFTSERKMMSVLVSDDGDLTLASKGAPDVLLGSCTRIDDAGVRELTDEDRESILCQVEEMSSSGLRTLGMAFKPMESADEISEDDEQDLIWTGFVGIIDPPREEAKDSIAEAHRAGIKTIMITGDHPATANEIANQLGIAGQESASVKSGSELDELGEDGLADVVGETSVYARVTPAHKREIVDALQADGHIVAMTGDGVNDAPALKTADIGVAMGITGTEVTKQAAKMILVDDNYSTIVAAVRQGRVIYDNIKKFLRFLLSSNMGEVATVFFGVVLAGVIGLTEATGGSTGIVVPLLATQILWINLVTDTFPALAMGMDPEIDDVMARKPRGIKDRIIDAQMWRTIIFTGLVMGTVTLLTLDMFLPGGLIEGSDDLTTARTAAFTTLVFAQLFNAFNARSETTSAFSHFFTNKWLWGAVILGAILQFAVVEVPFLQSAFSTTGLDLQHWLAAIGMASIVLWTEEIRKVVLRARASSADADDNSVPASAA